mmetsp:Transcript_127263/g.220184  ORF Transcript_127263/g.220184 Transcript_127263/m.220184 type:complete len:335 (+) Transcript_127263:1049-2053(+)
MLAHQEELRNVVVHNRCVNDSARIWVAHFLVIGRIEHEIPCPYFLQYDKESQLGLAFKLLDTLEELLRLILVNLFELALRASIAIHDDVSRRHFVLLLELLHCVLDQFLQARLIAGVRLQDLLPGFHNERAGVVLGTLLVHRRHKCGNRPALVLQVTAVVHIKANDHGWPLELEVHGPRGPAQLAVHLHEDLGGFEERVFRDVLVRHELGRNPGLVAQELLDTLIRLVGVSRDNDHQEVRLQLCHLGFQDIHVSLGAIVSLRVEDLWRFQGDLQIAADAEQLVDEVPELLVLVVGEDRPLTELRGDQLRPLELDVPRLRSFFNLDQALPVPHGR